MKSDINGKTYQENKERNPLRETGISPEVPHSSVKKNDEKSPAASAAGKMLPDTSDVRKKAGDVRKKAGY